MYWVVTTNMAHHHRDMVTRAKYVTRICHGMLYTYNPFVFPFEVPNAYNPPYIYFFKS